MSKSILSVNFTIKVTLFVNERAVVCIPTLLLRLIAVLWPVIVCIHLLSLINAFKLSRLTLVYYFTAENMNVLL